MKKLQTHVVYLTMFYSKGRVGRRQKLRLFRSPFLWKSLAKRSSRQLRTPQLSLIMTISVPASPIRPILTCRLPQPSTSKPILPILPTIHTTAHNTPTHPAHHLPKTNMATPGKKTLKRERSRAGRRWRKKQRGTYQHTADDVLPYHPEPERKDMSQEQRLEEDAWRKNKKKKGGVNGCVVS